MRANTRMTEHITPVEAVLLAALLLVVILILVLPLRHRDDSRPMQMAAQSQTLA